MKFSLVLAVVAVAVAGNNFASAGCLDYLRPDECIGAPARSLQGFTTEESWRPKERFAPQKFITEGRIGPKSLGGSYILKDYPFESRYAPKSIPSEESFFVKDYPSESSYALSSPSQGSYFLKSYPYADRYSLRSYPYGGQYPYRSYSYESQYPLRSYPYDSYSTYYPQEFNAGFDNAYRAPYEYYPAPAFNQYPASRGPASFYEPARVYVDVEKKYITPVEYIKEIVRPEALPAKETVYSAAQDEKVPMKVSPVQDERSPIKESTFSTAQHERSPIKDSAYPSEMTSIKKFVEPSAMKVEKFEKADIDAGSRQQS